MTEPILQEHRLLWQKKPQLRAIYEDYYRQIALASVPGTILEIGGGSGNLKGFIEHVVSTDIVHAPWLDVAVDAQALPFADESFANIVGIDVLHHVERPRRLFAEAERVLKPGGRIILVEPAITLVSGLFYRHFHPEPVIMNTDPLADGPLDPSRKPFDANQAIPTLLFGRHRKRFEQMFPGLRIIGVRLLSLIVYPMSGGFRPWCLVPAGSIDWLLRLERVIAPVIGSLMAFRLFAVIEKIAD
ncbi:MAG: class I SAM-dependent methyltransferase [Burkholderiales bacterium]|nr:class I SAM-dependent methyltransferase [Burkholderiales bacterium]